MTENNQQNNIKDNIKNNMINKKENQNLIFELNGVKRIFNLGQTQIYALRNMNLKIERGEFTAIWGPSGSGKSTLLNILGLIDSPDSGLLKFDGKNIENLNSDELSDLRSFRIGFIFQNFNLIPVLTALENICLPLHIQGVSPVEAQKRAKEVLAAVGLENFAAFRPDRLSGGQRQRVAIARALVTKPDVLIADEPTANLDSKTSREVIDLLQKLNQETNVTCLFTTHDPRLLARVPRQLKMQDGELVEEQYQDH